MTSFFRALRDAKETDVDGQNVLKLDIDKGWDLKKLQLFTKTTKLNFLLREENRTLLNNMRTKEDKQYGAIIVGTSGIGKSAFRFYVMRQWLNNDEKLPKTKFPKVIFNLGDVFYGMDEDGVVSKLPEVHSLAMLPARDWHCLTLVGRLQACTRASISISCS